ncbi:MAG TPA: hypothetical protein VN922_02925 [Bacteroidia bacterium]|nr:hypothetical protein [Bacteroidia bacterium]
MKYSSKYGEIPYKMVFFSLFIAVSRVLPIGFKRFKFVLNCIAYRSTFYVYLERWLRGIGGAIRSCMPKKRIFDGFIDGLRADKI